MLKYRQRNGWTHRDMLRLSHPAGRCAPGCDYPAAARLPAADLGVRGGAGCDHVAQWEQLITDNPSLSWEMLPDAALASRRCGRR